MSAGDRADHDSPWKDAIERFFPEFMAFFFPAAFERIDWTKGYEFLDKELQAVAQDAELGRRFVDKLVRVTLVTGEDDLIYVHVEVQGTPERDFAERIFVYNYRLFDRYRRPVASLAVLADDSRTWRPDAFGYDVLGCRIGIRFPVAKLIDHAGSEAALLAGDNAFGLVTAAHLNARATRRDDGARLEAKWTLVRCLYDKQWDRQRIIALFLVLDWMMRLPSSLARELQRRLAVMEGERNMPYVSSIEQIGIEKGIKQGLQQGKALSLIDLLETRFGPMGDAERDRILAAAPGTLKIWLGRVLEAPSLQAVLTEPLVPGPT